MTIHYHIAIPEIFKLISSNKRPYFIYPFYENGDIPKEGDIVILSEVLIPVEYTGNITIGKVKYAQTESELGLLDGYMIVSLEILYTTYEQQISNSNH